MCESTLIKLDTMRRTINNATMSELHAVAPIGSLRSGQCVRLGATNKRAWFDCWREASASYIPLQQQSAQIILSTKVRCIAGLRGAAIRSEIDQLVQSSSDIVERCINIWKTEHTVSWQAKNPIRCVISWLSPIKQTSHLFGCWRHLSSGKCAIELSLSQVHFGPSCLCPQRPILFVETWLAAQMPVWANFCVICSFPKIANSWGLLARSRKPIMLRTCVVYWEEKNLEVSFNKMTKPWNKKTAEFTFFH